MKKKSNCIACFLCIIIEFFVFLSFDYIDNCGKFIFSSLLAILSLVGIGLLFLSACSLLYYYFSDDTIKDLGTLLKKIGQDITHIFSWLFSVNGFLFIILCAIVALVCFFICRFWGICGCNSGNNNSELDLTALTLTIALAAIIPAIITKIVNKSEIESITNEKINERFEQFNATLFAIRKDKAHEGRMSASLLYEFANLQEKTATSPEDYKLAIKNAAWSIGWASTAIGNYLNIKNEYKKSLEFINELFDIYIIPCKNLIQPIIPKINLTNEEKNEYFKQRDLRSIIIMHALIKHYGYPTGYETVITNLEQFFMENNPNINLSNIDCQIFGMNDEFNKRIKKIGDDIIIELKTIKSRYS